MDARVHAPVQLSSSPRGASVAGGAGVGVGEGVGGGPANGARSLGVNEATYS